MTHKISLLSCVIAGLLLVGCDQYEAVRVDSFPYGNQRTAGTSIAYVLKKIAPEKKLKIEPYVAPAPELPVIQEFDVKVEEDVVIEPDPEMEKIEDSFKNLFKKEQQK